MSQTETMLADNERLSRNTEPQWFAACTRSRHEKRVAEELEQRGIESFLPLCRAAHRWKDRRKIVALPLFPGYLFVHIPVEDRLRVLELYGVARFVGFSGMPVEVPERDIRALRSGLVNNLWVEPHPYLKVGGRVRVRSGPLAGAEGILVRKKGDLRLVLSFDAILRAVAVEVDASDVEPVIRSGQHYRMESEQAVNGMGMRA
jgi:transcription antitermination factor NusG